MTAIGESTEPDLTVGPPRIADGVALHRLAQDSGTLDVNSRYAYLLWAREFADTSVVARRADGEVVGFVTGFRRPAEPSTLLVWQVAVDARARGTGVAGRMLDALVTGVPGLETVETTVTPDNAASDAMFTALARRHGAGVQRTELFGSALLGPGHEPEYLYRIGPLREGEES